MAISFVGGSTASVISGGDATLTLPAGTTVSDLVIVAYVVGDNDNIDFDMAMITTGYTEVADLFADGVQDSNMGVFWKVMSSTPDTTAVVDGLGGTDAAVCAACLVFRGVDTSTPLDVTSTTGTSTTTADPDPPSIDFLDAGAWIVVAAATAHTLTTGSYTFPTGYTTNAISTSCDDTGSDSTIGMCYNSAPSNPEDPGLLNHSGADSTNFSYCVATLALRPAGAAPAEDGISGRTAMGLCGVGH